jgi:hypothetical protein
MRLLFPKLVSLLGCIALSAVAAGANVRAVFPVVFAPQKDAPVRIVSLTQTLTDTLSEVTVKNFSDKPVSSYQLGWVVLLPNGCSRIPTKPLVTLAPVEEIAIAPGETATTGHYRLWFKQLHDLAYRQQATLVHVQVGVVSVKFTDGSSWSFNLAESKLFDSKILEEQSNLCTSGQVEEMFQQAPPGGARQ